MDTYRAPSPAIKGWMGDVELAWLYQRASEVSSVVEVGSWAGKSTHALLSGCCGPVYAVDTWQDGTAEWWAIRHRCDPFREFIRNVGRFPRLHIIHQTSQEAAAYLPDPEMVFIDGSHRYEDVRADLEAWAPKARVLLAGHDYHWLLHPGVRRAVREVVGEVEHIGSIWFSWR